MTSAPLNRNPGALVIERARAGGLGSRPLDLRLGRDQGGNDLDLGSLLAALALGFVCGVIGRMLVPNDAFRHMSGLASWGTSTLLGLAGALVGYWIFTGLLGIGDDDKFDWGGMIGAVVGAIIVVALASWIIGRSSRNS